jgi:hypothetical protein
MKRLALIASPLADASTSASVATDVSAPAAQAPVPSSLLLNYVAIEETAP